MKVSKCKNMKNEHAKLHEMTLTSGKLTKLHLMADSSNTVNKEESESTGCVRILMTEHAYEAQLIYTLCNEHCNRTGSLFPGTCNCSNRITHPPLPLLSLGLIVNTFQCENASNFHQIWWFLASEISAILNQIFFK